MKQLSLVVDSPRKRSPVRLVIQDPKASLEADATASITVGENGSLKVLSKSQEYRFTSEGFVRTTSQQGPCASPDQHCYLVSEKDVRIIRTLGRGASSVVYKAFYAEGNTFVAIKKINCFDKDKRSQMLRDVKALTAANGPGLVHFFGAYHSPECGQIAIALEYMNGGSLGDVVQKVEKISEPLLACITAQVLQGLSYLHRQHTVHRDIKPANILLNSDGKAKIADFGISAFIDSTLAVCQTFLGTVTYMSPERINSEGYSFPADIWSLGLTLVECATGRYPYDASGGPLQLMIQVVEDPAPLPPAGEFSEPFREFVRCCLHKDPLQRPSAESLLDFDFIRMHAGEAHMLQDFMENLCDPDERLEDMVLEATSSYYTALSGGRIALPRISSFYTSKSELLHEATKARGQTEIMKALSNAADLHAVFGQATHTVDVMDIQPLQGRNRAALAHVTGHITVTGLGPLGAAMAPVLNFAEAFTVERGTDNRVKIINQIFKMLPT